MSDYQKPLPVIQPHSQAFWEGTKAGKLLVQQCQDCNAIMSYPRQFCTECWSDNTGWKETSGKGKVFSFSITYEGVEPMFKEDLPIVLAWVDLPEGVRMNTNILDCNPADVKIGMDVEVVYKDVSEEISLPYFRPVKD